MWTLVVRILHHEYDDHSLDVACKLQSAQHMHADPQAALLRA